LLSVSCKKEEDIKIVELGKVSQINITKHLINSEFLIPAKLFVFKNKLIVFEDLKENIFKVINLPELRYNYSFGVSGQGPNEFMNIGKESINCSDYLEIFDLNKIKYLNITDSKPVFYKELDLSWLGSDPINNLRKINDSIYFCNNFITQDNDKEFQEININKRTKTKFGDFPDWNKKLNEPIDKNFEYVKATCHNELNKKFVVFYYHYPIFKIFSDKNKILKTIRINLPKSKTAKNKLIYFTEPCVTNEYIYVMWINKTKEEVSKNPEGFSPEMLIFDWEGNLVSHYSLKYPIITFTVSETYKKIYATSFLDSNTIFEYDLNIKSQDKCNYTKLSNKWYSLNMLTGYEFCAKNQEEINRIYEKGDYSVNTNFFAQKINKKYKNLQSIIISIYIPKKNNADLRKDISKLFRYEEFRNVFSSQIQVEKTEVQLTSYIFDGTNPKGKKFPLFCNSFTFNRSNHIIEITVCSIKNDLESYRNYFQNMITSFVFSSSEVF